MKIEISEKQLEDLICMENAKILQDNGLDIFSHDYLLRQVNIGGYGKIDLLGVSIEQYDDDIICYITIYELKKDLIGLSSLGQICRYNRAFRKYSSEQKKYCEININTVLIGSKIDLSGDFIYTASLIDNLYIYQYNFNINGLLFEEINPLDYYPTSVDSLGVGFLNSPSFESYLKPSLEEEINQ